MLERLALDIFYLIIFYGGGIGLVYLLLHFITEPEHKQ